MVSKTGTKTEKKPSGKLKKTEEQKTFRKNILDQGQREQMVAQAAYFRAEHRGFDPQGQEDDWYQAEKEVDEMLR